MIQPQSRQLRRASPLVALPILLLLDLGIGAAYGQQTAKPEGDRPSEKAPGQEFTPRGQRAAREIKYSDWRKFCFEDSWNEPGMPNDDQRYIRDGSVGRAHRPH